MLPFVQLCQLYAAEETKPCQAYNIIDTVPKEEYRKQTHKHTPTNKNRDDPVRIKG